MSAWVAVGVVLEVLAALCLVVGRRRGALDSRAPERDSAPLPPWRPLLLYSLGGGLAIGGLSSLREDLGWPGVALGLVVLLLTAGVLRVLSRRRRAAGTGGRR